MVSKSDVKHIPMTGEMESVEGKVNPKKTEIGEETSALPNDAHEDPGKSVKQERKTPNEVNDTCRTG